MSQPPSEPLPNPDDAPDDAAFEERLAREAQPATVRRAPRYRRFVQAGALLGVVVAALVVVLVPGDQPLGRGPVLVFVALLGVLVGGLLGAVAAVLADRSSRR